MRRALIAAVAVTTAVVAGTATAAPSPAGIGRPLTIMTRNLDAGTDYGPAFAARTPLEFVGAATAEWEEIVASNVPERMAGIASEIARTTPDVVSLQEVSLFRTGPPSFSGIPQAQDVAYDQLGSLLSALQAEGLHYRVVKVLDEFDVEAPTFLGFDVRNTDRDVLLVRSDLPATVLSVSNVQAAHYSTLLTLPTPVGSITIPRGWIAADVTSLGRAIRVVSTHLEASQSAGSPETAVATAEAHELLAGPAATALPVVLAGDFNTGPGVSPTYDALLAGGVSDTWTATHPNDPGYTWPLHAEDPANASTLPTIRIDLVLERGLSAKSDDLVGTTQEDLTPSGLWPSDHAGVVATLQFERPAQASR